jgi:hypothetical protein
MFLKREMIQNLGHSYFFCLLSVTFFPKQKAADHRSAAFMPLRQNS